jgi:pyruvate-formate lyase-activating enzyme
MKKENLIAAVVANSAGEIFDLAEYAAVGMAGDMFVPLSVQDTIPMPYGSELMLLPDRLPMVYNLKKKCLETLTENPYIPGEPVFSVAAFNSPGYVLSYLSAYQEKESAKFLPLFSYGAAGWHHGKFRTAAILVDSEPRQDLRQMQHKDIIAGVRRMRKRMPENRLRQHLEKCALEYSCPAGKNFFLARYEAPLPTSQQCNARCLGCLSLQKNSEIPSTQQRIAFTPSPQEIVEVALEHIGAVKHSVVSFGQGCEGDPLLAADVILPAIRLIRAKTSQGTINMNTNGGKPDVLEKLMDAGLDSVRISMNSVRETCYHAYFRPKGYVFSDVMKSIDAALIRKKFVSVNYLNCPGFTDTPEESEAFSAFLKARPISMIQWRNLNFDPRRYQAEMNKVQQHSRPIGMKTLLDKIRRAFPALIFGYFNPPKEKSVRNRSPKHGFDPA